MMCRHYTRDEIIKLKNKPLDKPLIAQIHDYIKNPKIPEEGYIQQLYNVTLSQLIIKAGFEVKNYPAKLVSAEKQRLEYLANRLTTRFLKRKLNRIKKPQPLAFKMGSEILDPHNHLSSIYVKDHKYLLNLLPDFNDIYIALRDLKRNSQREEEIRSQQEILTDIQFLGRPPKGGLKAKNDYQRLNPTVGYIRGNQVSDDLKEGCIRDFASEHQGICRCCDMCGPETNDSPKDLERYLNHAILHKAEIIRVHIGETLIPSHGKYNVEQLFLLLDQKRSSKKILNQVIRLGHGTHMGFQSMKEAAKKGYYVEACLSSNKETGIVGKRNEYPLGLMLLLDVKVMIGTDGGDLYYTDLKTEYAHAKKNIGHFLNAIAKGDSEILKLPNGDELQYQHVKELFADTPQEWADDKVIEFADLNIIENKCKQKININQLVENMNEFKVKMFPGHSKKAALADEPPITTVHNVVEQEAFPVHTTKTEHDLKLKDLLDALDGYKLNRKKFAGSNPEYKRTFFCIGFGFSKTQKLLAVAALKNALQENPSKDLTTHLATLRNGELGRTIRTFLKKTDTTPFLGNNVNTVSKLVEHLSKPAQSQLKI